MEGMWRSEPCNGPRPSYQRSNRFPTQAAPPATTAIAIEYQVATNNGLSSGQVSAYSIDPTPPATNPAVAPATLGFIGAARRSASNRQTTNGSDNIGTSERQ